METESKTLQNNKKPKKIKDHQIQVILKQLIKNLIHRIQKPQKNQIKQAKKQIITQINQ